MSAISKAKRRRLYKRYGRRCARCGRPDNLTVDHKRPKALGGHNGYHNLQVLCRSCNLEKGAREIHYAVPRSRAPIGLARLEALLAEARRRS